MLNQTWREKEKSGSSPRLIHPILFEYQGRTREEQMITTLNRIRMKVQALVSRFMYQPARSLIDHSPLLTCVGASPCLHAFLAKHEARGHARKSRNAWRRLSRCYNRYEDWSTKRAACLLAPAQQQVCCAFNLCLSKSTKGRRL